MRRPAVLGPWSSWSWLGPAWLQGEAQVVEKPNVGGRWVEIANEMSLRYLGEDGPKYLVPTLNEPRWLFFIKPKKIYSWQGTDWARRYKHGEWGT